EEGRDRGHRRTGKTQAGRLLAKRARRALWRLAVSFLITPFEAVRSSTAVAARYAVSAAGRVVAERTCRIAERMRVVAAMLRTRRFALVITRFAADLWRGIRIPPGGVDRGKPC